MKLINKLSVLFAFLSFCYSPVILLAQEEIPILQLQLGSVAKSKYVSEELPELDQVDANARNMSLTLNVGHALGNRAEMFYEVFVSHTSIQAFPDQAASNPAFSLIPTSYYDFPDFSLGALSAGIGVQLSPSWRLTNVAELSFSDDFGGDQLRADLFFGVLSYVQKQHSQQLSYGFGLYMNWLEGRLLSFPILNLSIQNDLRGMEILFPASISLWQNLSPKSYVSLSGMFDSYSLSYQKVQDPDDPLYHTIFSIQSDLSFHYFLGNNLKFSLGLGLPLRYYELRLQETTINYSQRAGMTLFAGLSLVTFD
ncbi:MAG: hypothetical protein AAF587_39645 [Bacteroidota bacterium]